jgi:hypothetical protein
MLPPVTMSQPMLKGVPTPDGGLRATQPADDTSMPARLVRPEMPTAVDAARRAAGLERVRDDGGQRQDLPPSDDTPTGPPPTFAETPLQRQARIALDPPRFEVESVSGESEETGRTIGASEDDRPVAGSPDGEGTPIMAARGFADARADFAPVAAPAIDRTA